MNILILSKIYPADDLSNAETPVVHYFAKEWVKQGHNVRVIVNYPIFPRLYYSVLKYFEIILNSLLGSVLPRFCIKRKYQLDNVHVYRIPIKKYIPHGSFSEKVLNKQYRQIVEYLAEVDFEPDIAIGHWWNPQLPLLKMIKDKFHCKTALVLHSDISAIKNYKSYFGGIDCWGFRSKALLCSFEQEFGLTYKTFICYSGIPGSMLYPTNKRVYSDRKIEKFLFVGQLIKRKYPAEIIQSIVSLYKPTDKYIITYIGEGTERKRIQNYIDKYCIKEHIVCLGRIPRSDVRNHMAQNECLIMISKNEAFGLVYLEAMSAGCLVIAAKNEGFDGIIKHGENGFLCEAGNVEELIKVIEEINLLSADEKQKISNEAIRTAQIYTDYNVARIYLNNIIELTKA